MDTKTRNLIAVILQGVILVLLFVPGFFVADYWKNVEWGHWTNSYSEHLSMAAGINHGFFQQTSFDFFGWLSILAALAMSVIYILQLLSSGKNQNLVLGGIGPFVETGLLAFYAVATVLWGGNGHEGDESHYSYEFGVMFFVIAALLIALCIFAYVTFRKYEEHGIQEAPAPVAAAAPVPPPAAAPAVDPMTQLVKLKELMDAQVITQEEFDAKKKQLLGL